MKNPLVNITTDENNKTVIDIRIVPSGAPRITVIFPTAELPSDEARAVYLANCIDDLTMRGWVVNRDSMKLVRAPGDKPGEKTTLTVLVRPCKNENEAAEIRDYIRTKLNYGV